MENNPANPLIVQSDRTLLLDVHAPLAEEARSALLPFAELEKSPEHLHTYRISPLSLWNAASAGLGPADVLNVLEKYSRYPVPLRSMDEFADIMSRYGKIRLVSPGGPEAENGTLFLTSNDEAILAEIGAAKALEKLVRKTKGGFLVRLIDRGSVKRELIKLGWPVQDEAPLVQGEALEIKLREVSTSGKAFAPRDYQNEAAAAVLGKGGAGSGYGVVVLPCGSGKTMVGMLVMSLLKTNTLILTTNVAAVHQWINELLDKTELTKEAVAEYSGDSKTVAPVTIATYQILTWRPDKDAEFPHFSLFRQRSWGLIIYDEVHLLPAPVFRVTAELQAVRRLGLTATLVREDHAEDAVFSLVGPKRYDVPWKDLESKGWIASALCTEIRLDMPEELKIPYAVAPSREKYRMASENPYKAAIVRELIANHPEDHILVIGQYLNQLEAIAALLKVPLVSGRTANNERESIYQAFRNGEVRVIVVSRVANFAIDLPDASMAIQISGAFGSRQEEAQRLGRIIRPKKRNSYFYTLVSRYTVEEDFAANRQKFLAEQGYAYSIQHWTLEEILASESAYLRNAPAEPLS
ncbi:MAG: DEAD/DEAH box helicase [Spirochaetaceae bacterium]|jgi:DNA excision repair protein ERCC-3|nr:DEAD/DEAH box helicase [Spirochaetaceae bacterium]